MANEIDITSINLGNPDSSNRPAFSVELFPQQPPPPDSICAIPDESTFNLATTQLLPLIEACQFQFPDVTPIPPIYIPPQVKFTACEEMVVENSLTVCDIAKGTSLTLEAIGPEVREEGGPAVCGMRLGGNICFDACATFDANVDIKFANAAAQPTSIVTFTSASTPNCGFTIGGLIDVIACQTVNVTNDVQFTNAAKGSFLEVVKSENNPCDIGLAGIIDVQACKEFNLASRIRTRGKGFSGELNFLPNELNCGGMLDGYFDLDACNTFNASGKINLKGAIVKSQELIVESTSFPDCGVQIALNAEFDACREISPKASVQVAVGKGQSTAVFKPGIDVCSPLLEMDLKVDCCDHISVESQITYNENDPATLTLVPSSVDNCGFLLAGNIPVPQIPAGGGGGGGGGEDCPSTSKIFETLQVDYIKPRPEGCCDIDCRPKITMCGGIIENFRKIETMKLGVPSCLCDKKPIPEIDLCGGNLQNFALITKASGGTPGEIEVSADSCAGLFIGQQFSTDPKTGKKTENKAYAELKVDVVKNSGCCVDIPEGTVNYADMCRGEIHLYSPKSQPLGREEAGRFTHIYQGLIRIGTDDSTNGGGLMDLDHNGIYFTEAVLDFKSEANTPPEVQEKKLALLNKDGFYVGNKGGYIAGSDAAAGDETLRFAQLKESGLYIGTGENEDTYANVELDTITIADSDSKTTAYLKSSSLYLIDEEEKYALTIGNDSITLEDQRIGDTVNIATDSVYLNNGQTDYSVTVGNDSITLTDTGSANTAYIKPDSIFLENTDRLSTAVGMASISLVDNANSNNNNISSTAVTLVDADGAYSYISSAQFELLAADSATRGVLTPYKLELSVDGSFKSELTKEGLRVCSTDTCTNARAFYGSGGVDIVGSNNMNMVYIGTPPSSHVRSALDRAEFRKITICDNGVNKEAYVLMTRPLKPTELNAAT